MDSNHSDLAEILPRTAAVIAADHAAGQHRGFQICVSLAGESVVNTASGMATDDERMTCLHPVCWLSSGKPLTAVAIALLWQRGELRLDDRVADHLPEFAQHGKQNITIRHLLTHTGGFPNADPGYPEVSWAESVARVCAATREADWKIGCDGGYHVAGSWFVLGELVARVTGNSFLDWLEIEVLKPFDMFDCFMDLLWPVDGSFGEPAWMWRRVRKDLELLPWHLPPRIDRVSPGSSARGPIYFLTRFYENMLSALDGKHDTLHATTAEAFVSPHRVGTFDRTFQHEVDFALGFLVDPARRNIETLPYGFGRHASPRAFGHGGSQSSIGFADPEHGLAVGWAANVMIGEPRHNTRNREINTAIYEDLGLVPKSRDSTGSDFR